MISAELCCGTHATNTKQLDRLLVSSFSSVGDSSFEIDAITSSKATRAAQNDERLLALLDQMRQLYTNKAHPTATAAASKKKTNAHELYADLHALAVKSLQIDSIVNTQQHQQQEAENVEQSKSKGVAVSYLTMQHVLKEAAKYRPSKFGLQNALKKLLESENGPKGAIENEFAFLATNRIAFFRVESTLTPDLIANSLVKLNTSHHHYILFNAYKNSYIVASKVEWDEKMRQAVDRFEQRLASTCQVARSSLGKNQINLRLVTAAKK